MFLFVNESLVRKAISRRSRSLIHLLAAKHCLQAFALFIPEAAENGSAGWRTGIQDLAEVLVQTHQPCRHVDDDLVHPSLPGVGADWTSVGYGDCMSC